MSSTSTSLISKTVGTMFTGSAVSSAGATFGILSVVSAWVMLGRRFSFFRLKSLDKEL